MPKDFIPKMREFWALVKAQNSFSLVPFPYIMMPRTPCRAQSQSCFHVAVFVALCVVGTASGITAGGVPTPSSMNPPSAEQASASGYLVGVGIGDATGPAAEVGTRVPFLRPSGGV